MSIDNATRAMRLSVAPPMQKPWGQAVAHVCGLNAVSVGIATEVG